MNGYSESVNKLFVSQLSDWELARVNYDLLSKVVTKEVVFGKFKILVQFNPERMRSSAAKVDARSIGERPCFLCSKNRPSIQTGIRFEPDLNILVNPFPIFPQHLTIPSEIHSDQRILVHFPKMLELARAMPGFLFFYNGPQCGASAPDHFHFQAGNRGFLPIETDFSKGEIARILSLESGVGIWYWPDYLRGIVTLKGKDKDNISDAFCKMYFKLTSIQPDKPEPMLNILAYYEKPDWIIHIIPRKLHRPKQFFLEGAYQILFSPASVDLGGVIITPREEDFNKISQSDIVDMFNQVCFSKAELESFFNQTS